MTRLGTGGKTMMKIALIAAATALIAGSAAAQSYAPPMDLSWAMRSQVQNYNTGERMVRAYRTQIYRALAKARREGHPFNGVIMARNNPNTFGDGGYAARSNAQSRSAYDYDRRAVRGCSLGHDMYGRPYYYGC
jgi:hypothetical protein